MSDSRASYGSWYLETAGAGMTQVTNSSSGSDRVISSHADEYSVTAASMASCSGQARSD
jgi:hypothetical protein